MIAWLPRCRIFTTKNSSLFARATLFLADYLFALVNFFENIGDHWGSRRAAMDFAADVAFVESREGISRLISWQKPGKPGCRALLIFGSPLCRAGFTGYFSVIEAGLVGGAARAIYNID